MKAPSESHNRQKPNLRTNEVNEFDTNSELLLKLGGVSDPKFEGEEERQRGDQLPLYLSDATNRKKPREDAWTKDC